MHMCVRAYVCMRDENSHKQAKNPNQTVTIHWLAIVSAREKVQKSFQQQ